MCFSTLMVRGLFSGRMHIPQYVLLNPNNRATSIFRKWCMIDRWTPNLATISTRKYPDIKQKHLGASDSLLLCWHCSTPFKWLNGICCEGINPTAYTTLYILRTLCVGVLATEKGAVLHVLSATPEITFGLLCERSTLTLWMECVVWAQSWR